MASESKQDETAVVAGYGPGVGHSVATAFLKKGFSVALLSRFSDKKVGDKVIKTSVESIKSNFDANDRERVFPIKTDLTDKQSLDAAFASIVSNINGKVSVFVYNAMYADFATDPMGEKSLDFSAYQKYFNVGVCGLMHSLWNVANNKDLRADTVTVLLTGGGSSNKEIARKFLGNNMALLGGTKAYQSHLLYAFAKDLAQKKVFVQEIQIKVDVGGKPEHAADKIAPLYAQFYEKVKQGKVTEKEQLEASLITSFP